MASGVRVPDEVVERVRAEVDLLAVAERLTGEQFARATATEWEIRCPYPDHDDQTPSFHVNTEKRLYYCRGCEKSGDAIDLVQDLEGLPFVEAVGYVAGVMGIEASPGEAGSGYAPPSGPSPSPRPPRPRPRKRKPPEPVEPVELKRGSLEGVYRRAVSALPGSLGKRYLVERRKVPADLVRLHGLGYAPAGAWPYDDAWRVSKGESPRHLWEHGRIVVPHTRPDGSVVNLYGRAVGEAERLPPARREAFGKLKHRHLAGNRGYFNAPALTPGRFTGGEALVVCEGPLDALAVIAAGHERTVAIFGVNGWRPEWVPPDVANVVFAMDADQAGDKAWREIAEQVRRMGVRVVSLSAAAYGGEKDASAAYANGTLDLGELPVAPPRSRRPRATDGEERARRRAEAEAAMERALTEAQKKHDLDVSVEPPEAPAPPAVTPAVPTVEALVEDAAEAEPEAEPEASPGEPPEEPPEGHADGVQGEEAAPDPEGAPDNVVDLQRFAKELAEKRRRARKDARREAAKPKNPKGGE